MTLQLYPDTLPSNLRLFLTGTVLQGPPGKSAYDVAKENGYVGSPVEWLESLQGEEVELRQTATHIQWRRGSLDWENLASLEELGIRLRRQGGYIQWSPFYADLWTNLYPLADTQGPVGITPNLQIGAVTPGSTGQAEATITGTDENPLLNLVLPRGDKGAVGDRAWTPVISNIADGGRRVQALDWANGSGMKPVTGYIGPQGVTSSIAEATDVRGPAGAAGTGTGDMVAANNLSEVNPDAARLNIQAAHEGGNARFMNLNLGTGGASMFSDNEGSLLVHAGSPALTEAYFDFDKNGNFTAHQGSLFTSSGEVYHPGNLNVNSFMPISGGNFTGNAGISRGNAYTHFSISAGAGQNRLVLFQTAGTNNWAIGASSAANGGNFEVRRYDVAGALLDTPISVPISSGVPTIPNGLLVGGGSSYGIRYQSHFANGGRVDLVGTVANATGGLMFRDSAGVRRGYTHVTDVGNWEFMADTGVNFTFNRRPSFAGNLAWDAGNLTVPAGVTGYSDNISDLDTITSGFEHTGTISTTANRPTNQWHQILSLSRNAANGVQFALNVQSNGISYRRRNNSAWEPWVNIWHSDNFNPANYLPTSGGTITGGITATGGGIDLTRTGANAIIGVNADAGRDRLYLFRTGTLSRWALMTDGTAEGTGNAGSNFAIRRYSDAGANLGNAFSIVRSTGAATFSGSVTGADFTQPSDERLKENWREAAPAGWTRKLPRIKHGLFDLKSGVKDQIGVGAQGLARLLPSAVTRVKGEYRKVSYATAAMLGVIDLAQRVNELEDRLAKLEKAK